MRTTYSVRDLHAQLGYRALEEAYREGMTLSRWLEQQNPSEPSDTLDAFERQLAHCGIITRSNPEAGFYADEFREFEKHGEAGHVLQIEWMCRQYRKIAHAKGPQRRSILSSDASVVGSMMKPYVDAAQARAEQLEPAIPISELVAINTQIDNNVYRALYLNDDQQEYQLVRVGEAAEFPGAQLTQGEKAVDLYKYGRRLDISYEAMRRVPIDTVAFWIARMAIQAEVDKVKTIIDVLLNGDGNPGTSAEVINLGTLDPNTTAGKLSMRGWLAFKLKFKNPYSITHELVREDVALQQLLLDTGSSNVPLLSMAGTFGSFEPINPVFRENVRYGVTDDAPEGKILGFDSRFAIERITEIGGTINEAKKWVEKQVDSMVFSEVEGYAVIDKNAAKVLDLTAGFPEEEEEENGQG